MTTVNKLVQVAGIIDSTEADIVIEEGADWIGFALRLPSGKDDIAEQDATSIIKGGSRHRMPASSSAT